jgi:hypothetical protein
MKPSLARRSILFLGAILLVPILMLTGRWTSRSPPRAHADNGNPNNFYLWKTDSVITYNFRYDPHAADVWRFQAAGELKALNESRLEKVRIDSAP